jgi:hypothetical protein
MIAAALCLEDMCKEDQEEKDSGFGDSTSSAWISVTCLRTSTTVR